MDTNNTVKGYHQYCEGIPSILRRDTISVVKGYHQYRDTISILGDIIKTVEVIP